MIICRRGYADGPFGQVHYRKYGDGAPLILCHQALHTSRQFAHVYGGLARRGLCPIGIDLPGFGESDPTDFIPRIEDYARAITPVLDALSIDRADILGHHTGALVATEVALQFPDRIRRVVLNGPLPIDEAERAQWMTGLDRERNYAAKSDGSHLTEIFLGRQKYSKGLVSLDDLTRYVIENLMGYGPFWYGHHAAFAYDHASTIPRIRHPALILTNTGDAIYEHALRASRLRPDFAYAEIAGGGIDIVDQAPAAWVEIVSGFLNAP